MGELYAVVVVFGETVITGINNSSSAILAFLSSMPQLVGLVVNKKAGPLIDKAAITFVIFRVSTFVFESFKPINWGCNKDGLFSGIA